MVKKLIAISAIALVMTSCGAPSSAAQVEASAVAPVTNVGFFHTLRVASNTNKLNKVISQLKGYVHKTWYVFSGDTPRGWDCSGMTMWAYEQLGVNLEHRASFQVHEGTIVKVPKLGDIVAFTYKGSKSAYHVGIYLGPDKMIHAGGGKGDYTSIVHISKFAGSYSKVQFIRVIQTT
jgi:cell wall-associated NlpC family hydrolase